ncbi:MAG TPA: glycosyltransferase family 4 protein [Ideonella sp.]|nr:glycosyltransferase family 4 protein [Ideonella sp.]
MKVLVFAHRLEYGGTQVNAIELAAALRDLHGMEIVFFATPGPLLELVKAKGLRYVCAPDARTHPSPTRMRALRKVVRAERPDVLHVWDWWQCLDAYFSVHLAMGIPMVVTDMMMDLTRVLPKKLFTTFGTPLLVEQARADGRPLAALLLPPVDTRENAMAAVDAVPFRLQHDLKPDDLTLVTVSRLADFMKSESLVRTVDAVRRLGRELPLRLVIVGDGAARPHLQQLAEAANAELGRAAVTLAGALLDPRPAYAAADIVVGMGGSSLRGMAFGKPVVIVGERGFSEIFSPATADLFLHQGMYGTGDDDPGNARLSSNIRSLVLNLAGLPALGAFSRRFVEANFSLEAVSLKLAQLCRSALAHAPSPHGSAFDALRTGLVYLRERRFLTPSADSSEARAIRLAQAAPPLGRG